MLLSKDTLKFVAVHCIACMQLPIGLNTDNVILVNWLVNSNVVKKHTKFNSFILMHVPKLHCEQECQSLQSIYLIYRFFSDKDHQARVQKLQM